MSNKSDEEDTRKKLENWKDRLEAGDPIMTLYIDEPLTVGINPEGAVALKFVWGQLGNFQTAALALAVLSPAVARRLKVAFRNSQSIEDMPAGGIKPPSAN